VRDDAAGCARAGPRARAGPPHGALGRPLHADGPHRIAKGNDSSAPFLNPATAVNVNATVGLSINLFRVEYLNLELTTPPDPRLGLGSPALSRDRVTVEGIPSTLCIFADTPRIGHGKGRQGEGKVAGCFGTIGRESLQLLANGRALAGDPTSAQTMFSYTRIVDRFTGSGNFAVHVLDDLVLGASLQAYITSMQVQSSAGGTVYGGMPPVSAAFANSAAGTSYGLGMTLGATLDLHPITFGLVLQSGDLNLTGSGASSSLAQFTSSALGTYTSVSRYTGGFETALPWRAGLGVAYDSDRLEAEVNVSLSFPRGDGFRTDFSSGSTVTTENDVVSVAVSPLRIDESSPWVGSIGVGAEYYTTERKRFSVLGGFNATMVPEGSEDVSFYPVRESRLAWSLGVGSHGRSGTLMLGLQTSYGWGRTTAPNPLTLPPRYVPVDSESLRVLFVIAGTTSFEAMKEAAEDAVGVKKKDGQEPKPPAATPAK
jgi:hypothetical protein